MNMEMLYSRFKAVTISASKFFTAFFFGFYHIMLNQLNLGPSEINIVNPGTANPKSRTASGKHRSIKCPKCDKEMSNANLARHM